jgi:hypothetical protein
MDANAKWPRYFNIIIGIWLFISAFIWPHTMAQRSNTWICGLLAVLFAVAATSGPTLRYLNTALSVWLFISVWVLPRDSSSTTWNNVICAVAIFVISMVPSGGTISSRPPTMARQT